VAKSKKSEWSRIPHLLKIAEQQDFRCAYCDADLLESPEAFGASQWDHVVPGGTLLVLTCRLCNALKRDSTFSSTEQARAELATRRKDYLQRWEYEVLKARFRP